MKKYAVKVYGLIESDEWFDVEAENEQEAREKAEQEAEKMGFTDAQAGRCKEVAE